MAQLISIGDFSKASQLSIKALRYYHEEGMLVPAEVDSATGYRRYDPDQLATALTIGRLRSLELPVAEIAAILASPDPESVAVVLKAHRAQMEDRLEAIERILSSVYELLGEAARQTAHVHERWAPAQTIVSVRGITPAANLGAFLDAANAELNAFLAERELLAAGHSGALYTGESFDEDALDVEVFVPLAEPCAPVGRIGCRELDAQRLAVTVHEGPYEDISAAFAALAAWIAHHDRTPGGPLRELKLVGPEHTTDPRAYRTEVGWPV